MMHGFVFKFTFVRMLEKVKLTLAKQYRRRARIQTKRPCGHVGDVCLIALKHVHSSISFFKIMRSDSLFMMFIFEITSSKSSDIYK